MTAKTHTATREGSTFTRCGQRLYDIEYEAYQVQNLGWSQQRYREVSRARTNILLAETDEPTCKKCRKDMGLLLPDKSVGRTRTILKKEKVVVPEQIEVLLDLVENAGVPMDIRWLPPANSYNQDKRYCSRYSAENPREGTVRCVIEIILETKPE